MAMGTLMATFIAAPIAIDVPTYLNVQQQLQTATEAAALAGASKLASGSSNAKTEAQTEAYRVASLNPVGGKILPQSAFKYTFQGSTMSVDSTYNMPTLTSGIMCALDFEKKSKDKTQSQESKGPVIEKCDSLAMGGHAKAVPAARDTILVIDTSNSMDDLGNNKPFADVKTAANQFLTQLVNLNSASIDKVGLVDFNQTARLQSPLTAQSTSPNYSAIRTKITNLRLFSGTGWNTNYEAGLKTALDELSAHGRTNANKSIIFLTDGRPNLPAPASYYSYSNSEPYTKCTDIVENSTAVKNLCTRNSRGQTVCPVLPSSQITDSMISTTAKNCGKTYTDYMESAIKTQADRAKTMGVVITTVVINDPGRDGTSGDILARLLKDPTYDAGFLADYMADTTQGQKYDARTYDATRIQQIYNIIAQEIRVRLSS
jgi:hypothetical protein